MASVEYIDGIPIYSKQTVTFSQRDVAEIGPKARGLYGVDNPSVVSASDRIKDGIRTAVFATLKTLSGTSSTSAVSTPADIRRALVFRYDAIGDYIVSSPFISWLKRASPGVTVDAVASDRNASLIEADPFIDTVVSIDSRSALHPSWLKVRKHVRQTRPDAIAALVFTKMTKAALLAASAGGSATRLTLEHPRRKSIYGQVFDRQSAHPWGLEHWMVTLGNVGPRAFDLPDEDPSPYVVIQSTALNRVVEKLSALECAPTLAHTKQVVYSEEVGSVETTGRPYILINLSASVPGRVWSIDSATKIIDHLHRTLPDHSVLVSAGPDKRELVDSTVAMVRSSRCHGWQGSIQELIPLVAGASLVITPDTALTHIASTSGVPVIAVYSTLLSIAEWYPYGVPFRAILAQDPRDMNCVDVKVIHNAIDELVDEANIAVGKGLA